MTAEIIAFGSEYDNIIFFSIYIQQQQHQALFAGPYIHTVLQKLFIF